MKKVLLLGAVSSIAIMGISTAHAYDKLDQEFQEISKMANSPLGEESGVNSAIQTLWSSVEKVVGDMMVANHYKPVVDYGNLSRMSVGGSYVSMQNEMSDGGGLDEGKRLAVASFVQENLKKSKLDGNKNTRARALVLSMDAEEDDINKEYLEKLSSQYNKAAPVYGECSVESLQAQADKINEDYKKQAEKQLKETPLSEVFSSDEEELKVRTLLSESSEGETPKKTEKEVALKINFKELSLVREMVRLEEDKLKEHVDMFKDVKDAGLSVDDKVLNVLMMYGLISRDSEGKIGDHKLSTIPKEASDRLSEIIETLQSETKKQVEAEESERKDGVNGESFLKAMQEIKAKFEGLKDCKEKVESITEELTRVEKPEVEQDEQGESESGDAKAETKDSTQR